MDHTEWKFTDIGEKRVEDYLKECKAKRKEIIDAGIDAISHTRIPTKEHILLDINSGEYLGEDGYRNAWDVTDHHDLPIFLEYDIDIVEE